MALKQTLAGLIRAATITHTVKEQRLERGLIVSIKVTAAKTQLQLWRTGTARPSLAEWRTVLNAWPYPVRLDEPADVDERGMHGLSGSWQTPTQPVTQQTFFDADVSTVDDQSAGTDSAGLGTGARPDHERSTWPAVGTEARGEP
jgi:hypothetical protein